MAGDMEATPRLSIVTPVYNGEKFISGCIDCIVAQNCGGVEHLIVDGGSTDGTVQIIREKARTHAHLRWISEPDRGQSDAMNKGIAMAKAEYIGFLNVDDFYEPGTLCRAAEIIQSLEDPRLIVGACNVLTTDDKLLYVNRPKVLKFENMYVDANRWPYPHNPAAYFYPKSIHDIIGLYNTESHYCMDYEFILSAVQKIEPLYVDAVFANFRLIPGTKTSNSYERGLGDPEWRRIRAEAWRRAPRIVKLRVRLLSMWYHPYYRLKGAFRKLRRRGSNRAVA
jgi:glycosyltransferase involved in cell wall biosynthesis